MVTLCEWILSVPYNPDRYVVRGQLSTLLQHKNFKRKCKTKLYVTISSNHIDPKMY